MNELPSKIGKFHVRRIIGRGRTSVVYEAYDPYMDRSVAIKAISLESLSDDAKRERCRQYFFTEAKVYGLLQHSNILPVYDAGEDGNLFYLVMEYMENGKSLLHYCHPDRLLPLPKAAAILYQCCKALQYAHSRNVLHLDVKPGNILLTGDDRVKLADFGLASILDPDSDEKRLGSVRGTPTHISPERLRREPVSRQTDVYSLGVVMYCLLTGRRPFPADNLEELTGQILYAEIPSLINCRPEAAGLLEQVVTKALARDKEKRYATAAAMAEDLHAFHTEMTCSAMTSDIGTREKLDRIAKLPFFTGFFESELAEVVNVSDWLDYRKGQMIIAEDDLDESFFVIVEGEAWVVIDGTAIAKLTGGDCFGEMAYVARREREAAIKAASDIVVLKISNEILEKMPVYCQLKFTKSFLNTLISRLSGS